MNLLEILTTAEKLEQTYYLGTCGDVLTSGMLSMNYIVTSALQYTELMKDRGNVDVAGVTAVIRLATLYIESARSQKEYSESFETHLDLYVAAPLKNLKLVLNSATLQEQILPDEIIHS